MLALHAELLAEHGGSSGLRDEHGLESALARPRQKHHCTEPDLGALAAAYAFGLARNPFTDGNKRTALASIEVFLRLNGWVLTASEVEAVAVILDLATSSMDEETSAAWIRQNARPAGDP